MCSFDEEKVPGQDQPCVEVTNARHVVCASPVANLHDDLAEDVEAKAGKYRYTTDAQSPEAKTTLNHCCRKDEAHGGDIEKENQNVCETEISNLFAVNLTHAET
jgi:hypothetical protein